MSDELDSTSFNKNYDILKGAANWLSQQKEPNIDELVPRVEEAMKAYQICKERLEKVKTTLGQYFQKEGSPEGDDASSDGDGKVTRRARSASPEPDGDDEIPF